MSMVERLEWTQDNAIALAHRLRALHLQGRIKYQALVVDARMAEELRRRGVQEPEKSAAERMSRWLRMVDKKGNGWSKLGEAAYYLIIAFLQKEGLWEARRMAGRIDALFPDPMFHGTASFLNMQHQAVEDFRENFTGTYIIYRHSFVAQGHLLIGRLRIGYNERAESVQTEEEYWLNESSDGRITGFHRRGYIFQRNDVYRIVSKSKYDELQMVYLNLPVRISAEDQPHRVEMMSGVVMDTEGLSAYATRIMFVRAEGEVRPHVVRIRNGRPPKGIPPRVWGYMEQGPQLTPDGLIACF